MTNAMEKLAVEIERVSAIREQYRQLSTDPAFRSGSFQPAILMMTAAIAAANRAAGSGDALEVINAIKELEGFTG